MLYENIVSRKCPVCGKLFVPAPMHIYNAQMKKYSKKALVCSYGCMVAQEKKMTQSKRRKYHKSEKMRSKKI